jgi:hypothetical protein
MKKVLSLAAGSLAIVLASAVTLPGWAQEPAAPEKSAAADLVPLPIELPKPMFVGTPKNIRTANLEPQTGERRPPFLAPVGAANVALEKDVAASDEEPVIGEIEMIVDGDKEGADGSFVELGPGVQYVQIDLGAKHEIYALVVWHFHAQARVYRDVIVKVADDADFLTNVTTVFNNDHDNSSGNGIGPDKEYIETNDGKLFDCKGIQARYVRLYSNGSTSNDLNHYIEVEVYGKLAAN